ncbi:MAG TPA: LysR substrate-binding domain-containing protein [Candidatus Acidoferrales bacterium]|nr:LysR substrate-binding domain-containing protein [Candidatus Acidoferrales bacterium]
MELRLLRYFVAVAEALNVTRAAEQLHTAQPSLSQQIRQLEDMIGGPLFLRDKHRLQLTETGRVLLPEAREILKMTESAIAHARQAALTQRGTITVAMIPGPEGLILCRAIPEFMRTYPDVQVLLRTMTAPEQIGALLKREINVGFLRGPIEHDEIASEVYMREKVVAVIPEIWPISSKEPVPVSELAQLPHISISRQVAPAVHDVSDTIAQLAGVTFRTRLNTENLITSLNAVASNLGFCFFAEYVGGIVPKGVVTRHIDLQPTPQLELLVAYRKDDTLPPLREFLKKVREFRVPGAAESASCASTDIDAMLASDYMDCQTDCQSPEQTNSEKTRPARMKQRLG